MGRAGKAIASESDFGNDKRLKSMLRSAPDPQTTLPKAEPTAAPLLLIEWSP
jgi:hypothetical protein